MGFPPRMELWRFFGFLSLLSTFFSNILVMFVVEIYTKAEGNNANKANERASCN